MLKSYFFLCATLFYCFFAHSQQPSKPTSSEIFQAIEKLNFLGSVLYIAAHPDDENTNLISHLANGVKARTAYLSLTRGDGGQNLVGTELSELLGVIRTEELLEARKIDGGEQLFTRANDFGYSKHPKETLSIWSGDDVLSDVVLAIRKFQPDIIINRFDHRTPGTTHGHHTSSALLSMQAFDLANDSSKYANQLKSVDVWQTKRAFFNTSWWFYGSQDKFDALDKSAFYTIEVGDFYPSLGLSNPEIAALSRSAHKSQGFGNTGTRGSETEYLELLKGDLPKTHNAIFEGIDTSWNRVENGNAIGKILLEVQEEYDFKNPSASLPKLIAAYTLLQKINSNHWKTIKTEELKNVISACAGLYLEAAAVSSTATPNSQVDLNIEAINRSNHPITLSSITFSDGSYLEKKNIQLQFNESQQFKTTIKIPFNATYSAPYWLNENSTIGMYHVDNEDLIGLPQTPKTIMATFNVTIAGETLAYQRPVVYKMNDPIKGEVYKPFEIIPEVTSHISEPVIIFTDDIPKQIQVMVKAHRDDLEAVVELQHPEDWRVYPKTQSIALNHKGEEQKLTFTLVPPMNGSEGLLAPKVSVGDKVHITKMVEIDYDHIPFQTVLLPNESKVVRLNIRKKGNNIGYIEGAGDVVPESLRQIGYEVTILQPEDITLEDLKRFDALVVGIRAYNTVEGLKFKQKNLFDYVEQGGTLIVQYNTLGQLTVDELAPYPLKLSRDRVTDENSKVSFLDPNHQLLNFPNKITEKDFEGWVQERGLYFPGSWSEEFTPLFAMHDPEETPKEGSLLIAKHGKGHYIYTGLSFFREFPAGVSGAYRLFANMLSVGKENPEGGKIKKNKRE